MNYLYLEKTISNPVDSILLFKRYILTHHHTTLKVYDLEFALQCEKCFIDKILSVRKIGDDSMIVLFDHGKIIQCTLSFAPTCLRVIDGDRLDSYNNNCVVYNTIKAYTFSIYEEEIKEFCYSTFEIYNVLSISYMINYIPTLLISWKTNDFSKCSAINLDGVPAKVDEFEVLDDTIYCKPLSKFVVFLTRNCIQIKFKREMSILIVNENLSSSSLKSHFSQYVMEYSSDGSHEARSIFIESPQVFSKGDDVFVVNGNGEVFKIALELDAKRVLKAHISFEGSMAAPTCVDTDGDHVVLGSSKGDTILYSLGSHKELPCSLSEISRLENIGLICDLSHDRNGRMHALTTKGVYMVHRFVMLEPHEKVKMDTKVTNLEIIHDDLVAYVSGGVKSFKLESNLASISPVTPSKTFRRIFESAGLDPSIILSVTKYSDCEVVYLNSNTIVILRNGSKAYSFSEVKSWSLEHDFLAVLDSKEFFIFSLGQGSRIFVCSKLNELCDEICNEQITHKPHIEEVQTSSIFGIRKNCGCSYINVDTQAYPDPIIEVLLRKEHLWFIFLRTESQLYLYRFDTDRLSKVLLPKAVSFFTPSRSLFNLSAFVYCRSKVPYCIFLQNGVFIHRCNLRINYPVDNGEWICAMYKGHLLKCKMKYLGGSMIYNDKLVLEKVTDIKPHHPLESSNSHSATYDAPFPGQPVSLIEEYREPEIPKRIIHADDCIVLSSARYVPFTYVPFIPMVHISDGPNGKPRSEPINKEEAEYVNKNPALKGRTLRYYVDLCSVDYKPMSSIDMDENEIICDIKLVLRSFLVICTSFTEGEDKAVKGRAIVYSLVDIVPDPSQPHINKRLKLIGSESFKNACLQCEEIRGLLALCIGTRLMIYELNINTGLTAVGRNEIALLCTSIFVTKNFLAVSDIYTGIYFFFLRPRDPLKLHLLGKSSKLNNIRFLQGLRLSSSSSSTDQLSLLAYDKNGGIHIFTYSPTLPSSNSGNILIKRAQINTKLRYPLWITKVHQSKNTHPLCVSNNILTTVKAIDVQKIQAIHHCICIVMSSTCGLNPLNYLETEDFVNPECKSVISERILLEFFFMSPALQLKVCSLVGISRRELSEIVEICLQDQSEYI